MLIASQIRGQSKKASMIIIYKHGVVNMSNLLISTTLESKFNLI